MEKGGSSGIILRCASLILSRSSAALATAGWVGAHFPLKRTFCIFHDTTMLVVKI